MQPAVIGEHVRHHGEGDRAHLIVGSEHDLERFVFGLLDEPAPELFARDLGPAGADWTRFAWHGLFPLAHWRIEIQLAHRALVDAGAGCLNGQGGMGSRHPMFVCEVWALALDGLARLLATIESFERGL